MAKTILNAVGKALPYSGTSTGFFSATGSGLTLHGTAGNDSMWGDSAVKVTMSGGTGDDIYYLYSGINKAAEGADAGIDTISTWMSYTLPANFENLTVTGDGRYAFGNSADNIISGASGSQTIDGGAGNDVLTGGSGADVFLIAKGKGNDLITDFSADDKVRLSNTGIATFDQLLSHVTQVGANLKLDLGDGESLVFANRTRADLHANQFDLNLDRSALHATFTDNFDSLSLYNGKTGAWEPKFWWAPTKGSTLPGNSEDQWYVNPFYAPTAAVKPFSVSNGVLTISADPTPAALKTTLEGHDYTSGILTTHGSFSQTYGYFEIRADMPDDHGAWPGFWLLPEDGYWPPELDVVEMRGQEPNTVIVTAHSNATGQHTKQSTPVKVASTEGFHTYGVLWEKSQIVWYLDDVAIAHADTPSDMNKPMYMLVNLAVGGFAGDASQDLKDGADMKIDYIKAYSIEDAPAALVAQAEHASDWGL